MTYDTSYGDVVVGEVADLQGSSLLTTMYGYAPLSTDKPTVIYPVDYVNQVVTKQTVTGMLNTFRDTVFESYDALKNSLDTTFVDLRNNTVFVWGNYEKGGLGLIKPQQDYANNVQVVFVYGVQNVSGGVQPLIGDVSLSYYVTLANGGESWVYAKLPTTIKPNGTYKTGIIFCELYDYNDETKFFDDTNTIGIAYGLLQCCMSYTDGDDPVPVRNLHNVLFSDSMENGSDSYTDLFCNDMPTSDPISLVTYTINRSHQRKINYFNSMFMRNNYNLVEGTSLFSGAVNDEKTNPYPNSTSSGAGGYGGGQRYSEPCGDDSLPSDGIVGTGVVDLYLLTKAEMNSFAQYLYTGITESISNTIKRLLANPLDGIVTAHMIHMTPTTSGYGNIKYCGIDTGCSAQLISTEYYEAIYEINIASFYNNFLDYAGNTQLQIYIPFIGVKELDVNEFIGGKLKLTMKYDIVSGSLIACVWSILSQKGFNHVNLESCLYTFTGTCIRPIPVSGSNWSSLFGSLTAMSIGVMTENPVAVAGGIGSLAGGMVKTSSSSSVGSSFGYLDTQKPYIIMTHPEASTPNHFKGARGYKSNVTVPLLADAFQNIENEFSAGDTCFVKVRQGSLDLKNLHATDEEKQEIARLLYEGVYYEYN